jgi:transcriptional regulator with XRE-family HTH domain
VDDVAVGRGFRALRLRRGWSQRELGRRAGVDDSVICDLEAGRLELVRLPTVRRIGRVFGISIQLAPRWPVADVARLLDEDHAGLVERLVRALGALGWEVRVEYTFNDYGERGSVDVLAWHAGRRALLLVEVKTRVADIQDMHAAFDRKVRIVPKLLARERGWRPGSIGQLLVVPASHGNRDRVRRHGATFAVRFPAGAARARRWIRDPVGDFAGLWFVPSLGVSQRRDAKTVVRGH